MIEAETLHVRILTKDDEGPLYPMLYANHLNGEIHTFGVLQEGTEGKKTAVSFLVKLEDGSHIVVKTDTRVILRAADVLREALNRFNEPLPC